MIIVGRRHDVARLANEIASGTGKQVADIAAGTQTSARRNSCYGKQDSSDRLGSLDPQGTLHTPHSRRRKGIKR
jgi:hypothetical protein